METPQSVTSACRAILEIIILRVILRFNGVVRHAGPLVVRALVSKRRDDPIVPTCAEIDIKGVARHALLGSDSIRFVFSTHIIDTAEHRSVGVRSARGWFEYLGIRKEFTADVSLSDQLQVRLMRHNGSLSPVRFNRFGRMKVRRSDYE